MSGGGSRGRNPPPCCMETYPSDTIPDAPPSRIELCTANLGGIAQNNCEYSPHIVTDPGYQGDVSRCVLSLLLLGTPRGGSGGGGTTPPPKKTTDAQKLDLLVPLSCFCSLPQGGVHTLSFLNRQINFPLSSCSFPGTQTNFISRGGGALIQLHFFRRGRLSPPLDQSNFIPSPVFQGRQPSRGQNQISFPFVHVNLGCWRAPLSTPCIPLSTHLVTARRLLFTSTILSFSHNSAHYRVNGELLLLLPWLRSRGGGNAHKMRPVNHSGDLQNRSDCYADGKAL